MPNWYPTKKVVLDYKGETVERVVAEDLDRVYVGGTGITHVYYDAHTIVDGKHLFVIGKNDNVIANMGKALHG